MLLVGVVLQLLLDVGDVERSRIDYPLRDVLVRLDVACIQEMSSLCGRRPFAFGNARRNRYDFFFGRLGRRTHKL